MTIVAEESLVGKEGIAGKFCPVCGMSSNVLKINDTDVCTGSYTERHGAVKLSWQWNSVEEYENWYADPTAYHVDEQKAQCQKPYAERIEEQYKAAKSRLSIITPIIEKVSRFQFWPSKWIDIGSGTGVLLETVRRWGFEGTGIEPNASLCVEGVKCGTWRDLEGQWDVVSAFDVFEHLTSPRQFLRHLQEHLNEEGCVIIEMPELNSPHHLKEGGDWRHLRPRQHICLYSREAAEQLYREEGFEVYAFWRPLRATLGKMTHILIKVQP